MGGNTSKCQKKARNRVAYIPGEGDRRLAFPDKTIITRTTIHIAILLSQIRATFRNKLINEQFNKAGVLRK
jgi:hypothetical protein